jgi:hypothetical protein
MKTNLTSALKNGLAIRVASILALAGGFGEIQTIAATITNVLNVELHAAWSDTERGGATNLSDGDGGSYLVGWLEGTALPGAGNTNIMGGWSGGTDRGYSWDGTYDVGWASAGGGVGFQVSATGESLKCRGNDNWNGKGSAPCVQWTSGVAGKAIFKFAIGGSVGRGAIFGIYDRQAQTWVTEGDNIFTDTLANTPRPDDKAPSPVERAGSITCAREIKAGDKFIFAVRNATPIGSTFEWKTASVIVETEGAGQAAPVNTQQ